MARVENWFKALGLTVGLFLVTPLCGGAAPTATNPPPTSTQVPPTATVPAPTATVRLPTPTATEVAPKRGGTLHLQTVINPTTFDAHSRIDAGAWTIYGAIFDNIIQMDPYDSTRIVPNLAEKWTLAEDGKAVTFSLVTNARWHDGAPFTAKDVEYSFKRVFFGSPELPAGVSHMTAWFTPVVDQVQVLDDYNIRVTFKQPITNSFLNNLTFIHFPLQPRHIPVAQLLKTPIGTGPYKFVDFSSGVRTLFARNENYRKAGLPYLDGIEEFVIPSAELAEAALRTGQIDIWSRQGTVVAERLDRLKAQLPDMQVKTGPLLNGEGLVLNKNFAPFRDERVRRAIQIGIDRKKYIALGAGGFGQVVGSALAPPDFGGAWGVPMKEQSTWPGVRQGDQDRAADVAEAKRLLAAAGFGPSTPLKVTIKANNFGNTPEKGSVVGSLLKELGMESQIEVIDTNTYQALLFAKPGDFTVVFAYLNVPAHDHLQIFPLFDTTTAARNGTGFGFAEIDDLFAAQDVERDPAKRLKLIQDLQKVVYDKAFAIRLGYGDTYQVWRGYVKNYTKGQGYQNAYKFEKEWLDK